MRNIIGLFVLVYFIMSCSWNDQIVQTDIPGGGEPYRELIFDSIGSYLIGIDRSRLYRDYRSVVYRATHGHLKNWVTFGLSIPGENYLSYTNDKFIYLLNQMFVSDYSIKDAQSVLYRLDRHSAKLDTLFNFKSEYIKSIHFYSDKIGYAFSRYDGEYSLKVTRDGGSTWTALFELKGIIDKCLFANNKIYFTSWTTDAKSTALYYIDLGLQRIEILHKDDLHIRDFYIESSGDYWLVADAAESASTLYKSNGGDLKEVKLFQNSCKSMYKEGDFIAIVTYNVDESILGGLGGTRYDLYASFDGGNNWKQIPIPIDNYITPYIFYSDKLFLAYSGDGKLTYIDLERYRVK